MRLMDGNSAATQAADTGQAQYGLADNRPNLLAVLERANHIASMTSLDELLDQMLVLMIDICGGNAGTLYLLDLNAKELIFKVVRGEKSSPALVGRRMPYDRGIVGACVQAARPIVIHDLASDPRWYREIDPEKSAHLHSAISLPLLLQGRPIGAVQLFNFKRTELELLQLLANRMASEVDKVLMLDRVNRSYRRLQKLVEMLGELGSTLDQESILKLLTAQVTRLLEADRSTALLADSDSTASIITITSPEASEGLSASENEEGFVADSALSVPLRTRPIKVGIERGVTTERVIGNIIAYNARHSGENKLRAFDEEDRQLLEILASQASTVIQIAVLYAETNELFLDFIKTLAAFIDAKDPYTRGHSQRVSDYAVTIARQLGYQGEELHHIRVGSLLHDIGKIGVPDAILTKPTRLNARELEQMKKHPGIGYAIMSEVHALHYALPAIVEHHERLDGSGYPFGLRGERISRMGLIVAVADVFDAMTTNRPYRKAMDVEEVFEHLQEKAGTEFDPDCVQALIQSYLNAPSMQPQALRGASGLNFD